MGWIGGRIDTGVVTQVESTEGRAQRHSTFLPLRVS